MSEYNLTDLDLTQTGMRAAVNRSQRPGWDVVDAPTAAQRLGNRHVALLPGSRTWRILLSGIGDILNEFAARVTPPSPDADAAVEQITALFAKGGIETHFFPLASATEIPGSSMGTRELYARAIGLAKRIRLEAPDRASVRLLTAAISPFSDTSTGESVVIVLVWAGTRWHMSAAIGAANAMCVSYHSRHNVSEPRHPATE